MSTFERLAFYRGVSSSHRLDACEIRTVRTDRRPRDSSRRFHEIADAWFEKRLGFRYRSAAVFLTSRILSARSYGATADHVARVVPISDYRFCWSPMSSDLLFIEKSFAQASQTEIEAELEGRGFKDYDLQAAHESGHEVMLACAQYLTIPVNLLEAKAGPEKSGIILQ